MKLGMVTLVLAQDAWYFLTQFWHYPVIFKAKKKFKILVTCHTGALKAGAGGHLDDLGHGPQEMVKLYLNELIFLWGTWQICLSISPHILPLGESSSGTGSLLTTKIGPWTPPMTSQWWETPMKRPLRRRGRPARSMFWLAVFLLRDQFWSTMAQMKGQGCHFKCHVSLNRTSFKFSRYVLVNICPD